MLTFADFLKNQRSTINEAILHPFNTPGQASHEETNVYADKQSVIKKEGEYIKKTGAAIGNRTLVLGVCGAGTGLKSHVNQYKSLGFRPKEMFIFERDKKYFLNIAGHYVTEYLGINQDDQEAMDKISKDPRVSVRLEGGLGQPKEIVAILSRTAELPNIILGTLPVNGLNLNNIANSLKIEYDRKSTPKNAEKVASLEAGLVTHIDFDITDNINSAASVIQKTEIFFDTYPDLQSLVQVYYLARKSLASPEKEQEWEDFLNKWSEQMEFVKANVYDVSQRTIDAIKDLVRREESGDPLAVEVNNTIKDHFKRKGFGVFYQIYPGASDKSLVSITIVRNGGSVEAKDEVRQGLGETNINMVETYFNNIENFLLKSPEHKDLLQPYLDTLADYYIKSTSF